MKTLLRTAAAVVMGFALFAAVVAPSAAQEVPTGAARIIEKVQFRVTVAEIQIRVGIAQILENNAGVIPARP